jgi:hypothetical protein
MGLHIKNRLMYLIKIELEKHNQQILSEYSLQMKNELLMYFLMSNYHEEALSS